MGNLPNVLMLQEFIFRNALDGLFLFFPGVLVGIHQPQHQKNMDASEYRITLSAFFPSFFLQSCTMGASIPMKS